MYSRNAFLAGGSETPDGIISLLSSLCAAAVTGGGTGWGRWLETDEKKFIFGNTTATVRERRQYESPPPH